jgi:DNA-binding CsgD family transcriptional regulator
LLNEALRLFDETAFEPERWPTTLHRVGESLDANFFILFRWRADGIDILAPDHALAVVQAYADGAWYEHDLRTVRGQNMPEMKIATDRDLITPEEHQRGEYYRGFAAQHDIPHVVGWRFSHHGESYCFSANRTREAGAATACDIAVMKRLRGRATAAAVASAHIEHARTAGVIEGLGQAGLAVVALDRDGSVLDLTDAARALLSRQLAICEGRLASCEAAVQRRFAQFAHSVRTGDNCAATSAFIIGRGPGRFGLLALPVFCKGRGLDAFPGVGALLILKDLDAASAADHSALRAAFGLTPGEAEIAAALAIGAAPSEVADLRETKVNTVRHMIKAIYAKLGVSRAGEAAALLSRFLSV